MKLPAIVLLILFSTPAVAEADTIYVETTHYAWQWGAAPFDFDLGPDQIRSWLEPKSSPSLIAAPEGMSKAVIRHFQLKKSSKIKMAIAGPPRVTNGHDSFLYAWIEWVEKSKSSLEKGATRHTRRSGMAKFVTIGFGEKKLELREYWPAADLRRTELQTILPWDAAVVAKKIYNSQARRPSSWLIID